MKDILIEILIFIVIAGSAGLIWFILLNAGEKISKTLKLLKLGDGGWNSFIIAIILFFGILTILYYFVTMVF